MVIRLRSYGATSGKLTCYSATYLLK